MVVLVRYFGDTSWCPGMAGHGSTIISVFVFIMSSRREGGQDRGKGGEGTKMLPGDSNPCNLQTL